MNWIGDAAGAAAAEFFGPLLDWWHKHRLQSAEDDWIVARGKLDSMQESWCQWTKQEAEAEKLIAEGRMAYHRLHLGLNPFTGSDAAGDRQESK